MTRAKDGRCALCLTQAALRKSHIIPKFVVRHALKSSPGLLRSTRTPNRREQDLFKISLLCGECEQRLSGWESAFATGVFRPYHRKEPHVFTTHAYGEWCMKFAASVVWRAVQFFRSRGSNFSQLSDDQRSALEEAETTWRTFMLGLAPHPGGHELHIYPLGLLATRPELRDGDLSPYINRYLARGHDLDVVGTEGLSFVFVKLMRLVVVGFVEQPKPNQWRGGKLHVRRGTIGQRQTRIAGELFEYMSRRADACAQALASVSDKQKQISRTAIASRSEEFMESETFLAQLADIHHFGFEAASTPAAPPVEAQDGDDAAARSKTRPPEDDSS